MVRSSGGSGSRLYKEALSWRLLNRSQRKREREESHGPFFWALCSRSFEICRCRSSIHCSVSVKSKGRVGIGNSKGTAAALSLFGFDIVCCCCWWWCIGVWIMLLIRCSQMCVRVWCTLVNNKAGSVCLCVYTTKRWVLLLPLRVNNCFSSLSSLVISSCHLLLLFVVILKRYRRSVLSFVRRLAHLFNHLVLQRLT